MIEPLKVSAAAPRLLIADDDPAIVTLLAARCTKAGFVVETASNGIQALVKASQTSPDILIIDFNMPGADGLAVCSRLLDPARRPLNIVLMTGNQEVETVERCEGFGVFYVRKGIEFWKDLTVAMSETFPLMADRLKEVLIPPKSGAITRRRPRVLMIDDDPAAEVFFRSRLNKYSVDTLYAASAPVGFQLACKEQPSVIVSDYSSPGGDIYYLLGKLRTMPATQNIPVFVSTTRGLADYEQRNLKREVCGHPGVAHLFPKPFPTDQFFAELQKFVAFTAADVNEA